LQCLCSAFAVLERHAVDLLSFCSPFAADLISICYRSAVHLLSTCFPNPRQLPLTVFFKEGGQDSLGGVGSKDNPNPTVLPMPRTTTVDLLDLTEAFNAWCAQRQVSRSLAMRQLVRAAIGTDAQLSLLAPSASSDIAGEWNGTARDGTNRPYRLTLRLTQDQRNHLRVRAKAAGIACSRYILAALTARDSDTQAIAGNDAVQALAQSNDRLATLALKLASWRRGDAAINAGLIKEIQTSVQEHLARAAPLVLLVESTRVGRTSTGKDSARARDAKPRGRQSGP
jgi:hypothetical protein